jgi:hypothetical protein
VASHWSVRAGHGWREGEEWIFRDPDEDSFGSTAH